MVSLQYYKDIFSMFERYLYDIVPIFQSCIRRDAWGCLGVFLLPLLPPTAILSVTFWAVDGRYHLQRSPAAEKPCRPGL